MRSLKAIFFILFACTCLCYFGLPNAATASADTSTGLGWSYQAETGPTHWAELDERFALCATGQSQSPIDLTAAVAADLVNPEFHYSPAPLNLLNNGHTVQVPYAPGSYILLAGKQYDLLQFHFHSPSEHTIEGQPQAAELHLVHQNDVGELAVVAVMLQAEEEARQKGDGSMGYDLLSAHLPRAVGDKVRTGKRVNVRSLLPTQTTTYRYQGSLTTPPCSESVTWLIMSEPVALPPDQLSEYQTLLKHNNRPLQNLNSRSITLDSSP